MCLRVTEFEYLKSGFSPPEKHLPIKSDQTGLLLFRCTAIPVRGISGLGESQRG